MIADNVYIILFKRIYCDLFERVQKHNPAIGRDFLVVCLNSPSVYSHFEHLSSSIAAVTVLDQAEETQKAYWIIDKDSGSSRILFAGTDSPEWLATGYPMLLTENNDIYFISDTNNMDGFYGQTFSGSEEERPLLLKYHI